MIDPGASGVVDRSTVRSALASSALARIDSEVLLAHAIGRDRAWLAAHPEAALTSEEASHFAVLARRRRDGEPVAYLTGRREFWGLALDVDPSVLIPRPETETLVETALSILPSDRPVRVLDLGTGSGAVALAIARERPRAAVLATDCAPEALSVARHNAARLGITNVTCACGDWYRAVAASRFDLIVSNPPYVADGDPHLAEGDLRFEPRAALAAGVHGLDALRPIITGAASHLVPGGWLAVEHGYDQAGATRRLFGAAGLDAFRAARDLAGIVRVAIGRNASTRKASTSA